MRIKEANTALYLTPFLADITTGCATIAVPLFGIYLGATPFVLGSLGFTPGITYVSLCIIFGKLSERWSRKNLILLGTFLYIAFSLILCFSSRIYQLYVSMLLRGVGAAMIWPALESWVAEKESKRTLGEKMGFFNVSWSSGITVGPLLGGILFGVSSRLPFYFILATSALLFLILFWGTRRKDIPSRKEESPHKTFPEENPNNPPFYIQISRVANFTLYFSMGAIRYIFPKLGTGLGFSASFLGILMFTLSFSRTVTLYGLGKIGRWQYRLFPLISFQFIALLGLMMVFASTSPLLFLLAFVLIGLGAGMSYAASLFYSVNTISGRGTGAAIHETVLGSGFFLGSLAAGAVAQGLSLRAPYLAASAVVVAGVIIQIFAKRKAELRLHKS